MQGCRLRVFENRVLRRIFGPEGDEVIGEWKKLHNKELNELCLLLDVIGGNQIKKNKTGGTCSTYGGGELRTGFWWVKLEVK
jgi:hypothetical protein